MKDATRVALAVVALLVLVSGLAAGSITISKHNIDNSQRQWCDTLQLLTSHPVTPPADPATHPAQANEYRFYVDFVRLRNAFGCK